MSATVGVLALQGDVREHLDAIERLGHRGVPVRRATEVAVLDGLIIPGGESTTMSRLLDVFALREPLAERLAAGLPAYGSCAGMIMLATRIVDGRPDQRPFGVLDVTVRRNAFGRQVDSFEGDVDMAGIDGPVPGVFIRAPWVERVGPDVEVLATAADHPVAVRQGPILATSFHPEISGDLRVHRLFLDLVTASAS
ncbi:pyridoxal 5'-phosphate synthase glutaminase subunit PdxT [Nakamurella deserti]|uniref:pyridoxal 5'-phosphate synthase glutaminase subunit PdxT n=1 Tax=Nakamurella deserti TaxID=2164074 RepID=UPI000DBE635B|nr:pyridoxal 5'-phosphate synthase glutaminase subunit PdxT [Nakamurella deserti]